MQQGDSSTQAMTEVALGLSMAFFAILVLALISFSVPSKDSELSSSESIKFSEITMPKSDMQNSTSDLNTTEATQTEYLIWWQGGIYDLNLRQLTNDYRSTKNNVVIAISDSTSFAELLRVNQQFTGQNLSFARLSDNWKANLSEIAK